MAAFGADGRCLMRALQEELDDPDPQDCGRCAVCAGPRFDGAARPARSCARPRCTCARARSCSTTKKMAPDENGAMRKIPEDVRAEEGRALARLGDGGWDPVVQAGRRAGRFDDELVGAAAETVADVAACRWRGSRPCRRAARASWCPTSRSASPRRSGLPFAAALERVGDAPPQREMDNAAQQVANVRGAVRRRRPTCRPAPCLLVDDVRFSGWTLAMLAGQLRRRGAPAVYPLALTSAF